MIAWDTLLKDNARGPLSSNCSLTVEAAGALPQFFAYEFLQPGIPVITKVEVSATAGRIVLSEPGGGALACAISYALYRGLEAGPPPPAFPPTGGIPVQPPPSPSPPHSLSSPPPAAPLTTGAALAAALRAAEGSGAAHLHLLLGSTTFDCSGDEWPVDLANVRPLPTPRGM